MNNTPEASANLIKIENGQLAEKTINYIIETEKRMKAEKKQYEDFKAELLNAMEKHNIIKIDAGDLKINYYAEQTGVEVFDKDQFKQDLPDIYDEYCTLDGKKKAYIKISVK